jgi:tetratricopeptide (TPR) repeat protein
MERRPIMARFSILLLVALVFISGCRNVDSGESQILLPSSQPIRAENISTAGASETDIIEQMMINREAYRHGLMTLIANYEQTGNKMMLEWAQNELAGLNKAPQYNYIIEASIAGPELKASTSITEADYMYQDALLTEAKARELVVVVNDDLLRVALAKYNNLIQKHPYSDKIDDAAFKAGKICEHFKDYSIALLYYQRAYQWDPQTPHPARFKAAYILDQRMARRSEALELYQQALQDKDLGSSYRDYAQKRIEALIDPASIPQNQK